MGESKRCSVANGARGSGKGQPRTLKSSLLRTGQPGGARGRVSSSRARGKRREVRGAAADAGGS